MIQKFSPAEMEAFDRQRGGRRWWHALTDPLPWSRKSGVMRQRRGKILDSWVNPDADAMGGGAVTWQEVLESTIADGTQISNSAVETIICPDYNINAYYMAPGRTLRFWAFGVMSNVVTTPGTLTFFVRWGGVAGTVLLQSAAITLDVTARTNALWCMAGHIVCRTAGASGTFMSGGWASVVSQKGAVAVASNAEFNSWLSMLGSAGTPIASGSASVTADTTTSKLLSLTAKFSVATSPTNLTANQRLLEVLN